MPRGIKKAGETKPEPPPEGKKQVKVTTEETFTAPIGEAKADPPPLAGVCPYCRAKNEIVPGEVVGSTFDCDNCNEELEIVSLDPVELRVTDDPPELEIEPEPEPDERHEKIQRLLRAVGASGGSTDSIVISVRRKPDPPNVELARPWRGQTKTVGSLQWDDSFENPINVELEIQRMFDGGLYLIEVRDRGKYLAGWTAFVDDPIGTASRVEASKAPAPPPATQPEKPRDLIDQLLDMDEGKFSRLQRFFGVGTAQPVAAGGEQTQDPLDRMQNLLERADSFKKTLGVGAQSEHVNVTAGSSTIGDIALLIESLGIKEAIQAASQPIGEVLGGVIADALIEARRKRSEAAAGSVGEPASDARPGASPAVTGAKPSAGALTAGPLSPVVPAEARSIVEQIVDQMRRNAGTAKAVELCTAIMMARPVSVDFFKEICDDKSPFEMVQWLASQDAQWSDIMKLNHSAQWAMDFQADMIDVMNADEPAEPEANSSRPSIMKASN